MERQAGKAATAGDSFGGTPPSVGPPTGPWWMKYQGAAEYTGWSVVYLRNLVCAKKIPFYGLKRSIRFRRDMLDLFLTNRDAAMRRFRAERNQHGS